MGSVIGHVRSSAKEQASLSDRCSISYLRTLRAIYELLLSEGGANPQSIREKIALIPADLQSGR